ncbi:MAG TPA: DUF4097 family beta strand repeat-containing protein [Fulvivirga sp.]|nr:DUF4097 family beta strand repeat-containing protein [Fulvivirga sp.]
MRSILTIAALFTVFTIYAQKNEGDFHLDEEYNIQANGTIDLSSSDARVFITGSNRTNAHIKIDRVVKSNGITFGSGRFIVDVENYNGDLKISERSNGGVTGIIGYYSETYTINIDAPEGISLTITGDDGDYVIRNIHGSIFIDADDADADLVNCKGDQFGFRLDDGDLTMDTGSGSIEIDMDDGDVNISNAQFNRTVADLDDGDFIVATTLVNNGEYRIRTQDGLIDFTVLGGGGQFNIRHDDVRITTDAGFELREKSDSYSEVTLASGSANVDIKADDGRVRLKRR